MFIRQTLVKVKFSLPVLRDISIILSCFIIVDDLMADTFTFHSYIKSFNVSESYL